MAHKRVGYNVKHASNKHERGSIGNGEPEDVGEEQREGNGHHLPDNAAGCGIAQGIAYFLGEGDGGFHGCVVGIHK